VCSSDLLAYAVKKGASFWSIASDLIFRLVVHLFTTFVQKIGIKLAERTDNKWIEYFYFVIAVLIHAIINLPANFESVGGADRFLNLIYGTATFGG
jgi:hypothetical protein